MLETIRRISILLYFNKEGEQPLLMQEMTVLTEFLKELPENIEVIWALYPDVTIEEHGIKLSVIAARKENIKG